jgi:predicted aspartyl protease
MKPIPLPKTLVNSLLALVVILGGFGLVESQRPQTFTEVPFEFVHNQIVVQAKIGGKGPFTMLLDTDTDPSAIDRKTAEELGLKSSGRGYPAIGGGTETNIVHETWLPDVTVGNVKAKDVAAATIDLTKIGERLGRPVHGVLGYSFLKDRIVQIDYPNSVLRFHTQSPFPTIEFSPNMVDKIAVPFRREDGDVLIDSVFVNGKKMIATLDTGSSGTFTLTPEASDMLGLVQEEGKSEESVGYNGRYENRTGTLKSFRIGRLTIESAPATFWLPDTGHDNKAFQVNIGNGFFKDFIMTFDFKKKLVVFERVE